MLSPLPQLFREEKWLKEGISTFLRWAALQLYPWHLTDGQLLDGLTKVCHILYGTTVCLSKRRLSTLLVIHGRNYVLQYCESFGVAALSAVNTYLERNAKSKGSRVLFAQDQLISRRFLYRKSYGLDPSKFRGSFTGPLVIATLVHHFQQISNAKMEPRLMRGAWGSLPRAALAISAAAVEHALILQANANMDHSVEEGRSDQIPAVLKSWQKVWQDSIVPYVALVACLEERDVRHAFQAGFQMYEGLT